jgi:hypothetical protein
MGTAKVNSRTIRGGGDNIVYASFLLSPLATSIAPRLAPLAIAVLGITLVTSALRSGLHWGELLPRNFPLTSCLLFAAYVLLSAIWSTDPLAGAGKAGLLIALILAAFSSATAAATLDRVTLSRAALAFAAGAILGALFVAFEMLSAGLATRTAIQWLPFLERSPKHLALSPDGEIKSLKLSTLNQNVNLSLFHLWPGLLALMSLKGYRRLMAMAALFAVSSAAIAMSEHDSSQVALVGSTLVLSLAWRWPRQAIRSIALTWCIAFVAVIPASFIAYQNGLHFAEWLPKSARARVILWEYTAEQTLRHPMVGVGVDSTPQLTQQQKKHLTREQPAGFVFPRTMGHHAHSIFLQTWVELGAIGAILFAIAGATLIMCIIHLPAPAQPFAAATFAAFALVSAFAWGIWQSWFMCGVALLPVYLSVCAGPAEQWKGPLPVARSRTGRTTALGATRSLSGVGG